MPTNEEKPSIPEPEVLRKNEKSWIQIARDAANGLRAPTDIEQVPVWRAHADGPPTLLMKIPIQPIGDLEIEEVTKAATPMRKGQGGKLEPGDPSRAEIRLRLVVRATAPEAREGLFGRAAQEEWKVDEAWQVVPFLFRAGEVQQISEAIDRTASYISEEQRALLGN